jgi:ribonuclease BN (tRNA processing enzyme)
MRSRNDLSIAEGGTVRVTTAGAGDAFGSGGRFQACIHIERPSGAPLLLDCGATALPSLRRCGLDPNAIGLVVVSHLHGDHFGGLPFLVLDGQFRRRTADLLVVGPPGTDARLREVMEVLYPGSTGVTRRFGIAVVEVAPGASAEVDGVHVEAFRADHSAGAPALALRLSADGQVIGYSGDTAWTPALLDVAAGADLFLCEGYTWGRPLTGHLDIDSLTAYEHDLACGRILLTHPSPDVLARAETLPFALATDGGVIDLLDG